MFTGTLKLFCKHKCAETQRPSPEHRCSGLQCWCWKHVPVATHMPSVPSTKLLRHCRPRAIAAVGRASLTEQEQFAIAGNGVGRAAIGIELVFEPVWPQTVDCRFKLRVLAVLTQSRTSPVECRKRGLSTCNGTSGVSC